MKSIEEKAERINLLLSPKCSSARVIKHTDFVKHLQTAVVVRHPEVLHKIIKKIILCGNPPSSTKTFSVIHKDTEERDAFTKCLNNTKKCHDNLSFRLAYLERLLLEDQINLREFKQFKAVLLRNQLAYIRDFAKRSTAEPGRINAKTLKPSKETLQHHIHPYTK